MTDYPCFYEFEGGGGLNAFNKKYLYLPNEGVCLALRLIWSKINKIFYDVYVTILLRLLRKKSANAY